MMNILIISENFLKGGLETYLYTFYEEFKKENNIYFGFAKFASGLNIEQKNIYSDFHFSSNCTIDEFCEDVNKIIQIITNKKIDLLVVNPFYSLYPAIFAAQLTNTKIVYINHGIASITFARNILENILFKYSFESTISKAFCVSKAGITALNNINYYNGVFLPNPINDNEYNVTSIQLNKKWALISRLDSDKITDIINFLKLVKNLKIDHIDIYGEGSEKTSLEEFVEANGLSKKVKFKGYSSQINQDILNKYTGVIGLGRVALEGLVMNYPVFLIGYGKLVGVIDNNIYNNLKEYNFVPVYCDALSIEEIKNQIIDINEGNYKKYQFRDNIINDFSISNYSKKFKTEISNIDYHSKNNMINLYSDIKKLCGTNLGNIEFYNSIDIYNCFKKNIEFFTNDLNIKTLFIVHDNYLNLENKLLENKFLIEKMKEENSIVKESLNNTEQLLHEIYNSNSWKLTNPLRKTKSFINKIKLKIK